MKLLSTCINLMLIIYCLPLVAQDPVRNAYKKNEEKADKELIDEDAAEFLVKATEGRMMNINEGKLAVLKGTTSEVRNYGQLMVKDQTMMLDEIKKIAGERNITLPDGVSDKKREGQMDLSEEGGRDFDEKFVKMMHSGLEDDIKLFEKAIDINDPGISSFAKKYLLLIQSHLEKLDGVKNEDH
jgi:putative membrane protein